MKEQIKNFQIMQFAMIALTSFGYIMNAIIMMNMEVQLNGDKTMAYIFVGMALLVSLPPIIINHFMKKKLIKSKFLLVSLYALYGLTTFFFSGIAVQPILFFKQPISSIALFLFFVGVWISHFFFYRKPIRVEARIQN
jgi:hypothetical protein